MENQRKLTIIMPTYNREAYIKEALDSVLMQGQIIPMRLSLPMIALQIIPLSSHKNIKQTTPKSLGFSPRKPTKNSIKIS